MAYKVVETCVVTEESIESILNHWTAAVEKGVQA